MEQEGHLRGQQLALVDDSVGGQRADVGMLVVISLSHPCVLNQLSKHKELHKTIILSECSLGMSNRL